MYLFIFSKIAILDQEPMCLDKINGTSGPPPSQPISMIPKWRGFAPFKGGGMGWRFIVPIYFVQGCRLAGIAGKSGSFSETAGNDRG